MPSDLANLQGTWRLSEVETDGQAMPAAIFGEATVTVDGDRFVSTGMGEPYAGTIEIVPRKKAPKAFDLLFTEGPPTGMRHLGIYKLDGDEWTICLATRGEVRPTRFATAPDTGLALQTLRRDGSASVKPSKARSAARPKSVVADAPSGPPTEIEGEWQMVSAVFSGQPLAAENVKWCKRITRGNVTKIVAMSQTMLDATFTIDAKATPCAIDYVNRSGTNKGKSQAGIYELSADSLRICMSAPGKPRPSDFASRKGDGRSFTSWRLLEK